MKELVWNLKNQKFYFPIMDMQYSPETIPSGSSARPPGASPVNPSTRGVETLVVATMVTLVASLVVASKATPSSLAVASSIAGKRVQLSRILEVLAQLTNLPPKQELCAGVKLSDLGSSLLVLLDAVEVQVP